MLLTCQQCEGFVPPNAAACPHCGQECLDLKANSQVGAWAKGVASAAAAGVVAVTLMACYGGGDTSFDDFDHDNYGNYIDCNDQDATIHPGAMDPLGDGIDQNCDGVDGDAESSSSSSSSGSSSSSSSSSSGGLCVKCSEALASSQLATPAPPFCSADDQVPFEALQTCACTTSCMAECGDNACKGTMSSMTCDTCMQTNCMKEFAACSAN